ncbi:MAG TPA: serine hydrolase domain-containing protein [Solirubrobacteraceae bacterium]|jgi:CubicO group peptidase (beta-lactamase class C family)|nr:serine hydrolase domain-containing protein [Solirubrobacteraceae bacterium]
MVSEGFTAPGFESVREEFERNFTERGDTGAALAVFRDDELVVDLWGGLADRETGAPWRKDSLQVIFSGTKALVGICLLMLIDRGELSADAPVSEYWPEFAAHGKEAVKVSDLASHQARLPAVRKPLNISDMCEDVALAAALAAQPQEQDPRAASMYHALTYGWLCGELVRRVDGRSVGSFFAQEIARPLGLELWIGLPQEQENRVATLHYADSWKGMPEGEELEKDELMKLVWANPPLFPSNDIPWNTREYHAAEIPAAGGIGAARSVARLYACLAREGELDGVRLLEPATILQARQCLMRGRDPLLDMPEAYGFGFELQTELGYFGPPAAAFGYGGAGGSLHGAWPAERVGFSYAMNQMRDDPEDPRGRALLKALHRCL